MFAHKSYLRRMRSQRLALAVLALAAVLGAAAPAMAASYALQIIQPRAGRTVANRYYKAYPGLVYDVKIFAIGGTYPYTFALSSAPSGMTIDATTGEITWPSPGAQAQPYSVTAQVTDSAGNTQQVSWPITVTTQGFYFLDANNGKTVAQGGTGTIANPWRSIADWYLTKYDTSYQGGFLYFRNGTYPTAAAPLEDGDRLAVADGAKPLVWLAYPGENPVIDTTGSYICIYSGESDVYFSGLTISNFTTNFGVRIDSGGTDVVFWKNSFNNLPASAGGIGTNASAIMIAAASIGQYWSIVDNNFSQIIGEGYGLLGYDTSDVLVQGNTFSDYASNQSKAIGPKDSNQMWFIRDNRMNMSTGQGIWVDTYNSVQETKDIEISYNLDMVADPTGYTLWVGQQPQPYGAVTVFRNTFVGAPIEVDNLLSGGLLSFNNDVVIKGGSSQPLITSANLNLISVGSELSGTSSSGIVDSNGNLAGSYAADVGTYGYQQGVEPDAPKLVGVQ